MDNAHDSSKGPDAGDAKVALLTTLGCKFCRATKAELKGAGVAFQEIDLSRQLEVLRKAKEITGQSTVPQVFIGGKLIGGADATKKLLESGELKRLMDDADGEALPPELQRLVKDAPSGLQELEEQLLPEGVSVDDYKSLHGVLTALEKEGPASASRAFAAPKATAWLLEAGHAGDEQAAEGMLRCMQDLQFLRPAQGETDRLLEVVPLKPSGKGSPLNASFAWKGKTRPASKVAEGLRQILLELYETHLSPDGRGVRYPQLAADPLFRLFVTATAELRGVDVAPLSIEERKAFFLNTYNVIIVHALAVIGPASNFLERLGWFSAIKYEIGGQEYSADAIEHGILRANRPGPASLPVLLGHPEWSKGYFKKDDPRLKQRVEELDKRIHFALNCGAKSCPPIKLFTPDTLEEGLQSAAAAFCQGEVSVDAERREVRLSKIFKWYAMDFGSKEDLLRWLVDYTSEEASQGLHALLEGGLAGSVKLKYNDYDWGTNSA